MAGGHQGRLVQRVGQVGTGKARRALGNLPQVGVGGQRLAAGVDLEDRQPPLHVRRIDHHLAVETSRTQQREVEHFGAVGGRQQDHAGVGLKAVHLDQELVERLLAFVVDRAEVDAALAADGVQLVDEDDARGLGLGLLEEVADAGLPLRPRTSRRIRCR